MSKKNPIATTIIRSIGNDMNDPRDPFRFDYDNATIEELQAHYDWLRSIHDISQRAVSALIDSRRLNEVYKTYAKLDADQIEQAIGEIVPATDVEPERDWRASVDFWEQRGYTKMAEAARYMVQLDERHAKD